MKPMSLSQEIVPEWKPGDRLMLLKTKFGKKLHVRTWTFYESEFPALKRANNLAQALEVIHHQLLNAV